MADIAQHESILYQQGRAGMKQPIIVQLDLGKCYDEAAMVELDKVDKNQDVIFVDEARNRGIRFFCRLDGTIGSEEI